MIRYLWCSNADLLAAAKLLAEELSLQIVDEHSNLPDGTLALWLADQGLGLGEIRRHALRSTFQVDFLTGKLAHRRRFGKNEGSDLLRAIGSPTTSVLDATAGFGSDGFILAAMGCTVTLCERNPVVRALLQDGMRRASLSDDTPIQQILERMTLLSIDAHQYLRELSDARLVTKRPAVVYLDPMYPERKKSALVKKEMRWIRQLVGDDIDAEDLLPAARGLASERVVVKRMLHAEHLAAAQPATSIAGKSVRFDVYLR